MWIVGWKGGWRGGWRNELTVGWSIDGLKDGQKD